MKVSVKTDKGVLRLSFLYESVRCIEYLGMKDTKQNRRYAERLAAEVEGKILTKSFNYAEYFPQSRRVELFGGVRKVSCTFTEYADIWLEKQKKREEYGDLKLGSYRRYNYSMKVLKKMLGNRLMSSITKVDIKEVIVDLMQTRTAKTAGNMLIPVRRMFDDAFCDRVVAEDVTKFVHNPKIQKADIEPFSKEEVVKILNYVERNHKSLYAFFSVLFFTGMRIGEVLALKWENVDFEGKVILVRENRSEGELTTLKTVESKRDIEMIGNLYAILKDHEKSYRRINPFVFTTSTGHEYVSAFHIIKRCYKPALNELGIKYRHMRQSRHTHAVLSLIAGDTPHDVAARLGHTSLQMLFQKYARFIKNMQKRSKLNDMF